MRQRKLVVAGIYQPTYQRQAYGRRQTSATLIKDLPPFGCSYDARDVPPWIARRSAVPMPRGRGMRWLIICPRCQANVTQLYHRPYVRLGWDFVCRRCLGLRYWSQYQGRRPEADYGRIDTLGRSVRRAGSPRARQRREARCLAVHQLWRDRNTLFLERQDLALTVALTLLQVRAVTDIMRFWRQLALVGTNGMAGGSAVDERDAATAEARSEGGVIGVTSTLVPDGFLAMLSGQRQGELRAEYRTLAHVLRQARRNRDRAA